MLSRLGGLRSRATLAGGFPLGDQGYRGALPSSFTRWRRRSIRGRGQPPDVIGLILDRVLRRTSGFFIRVCEAWILLNPLFKLWKITHLFSTIGFFPYCLHRKLISALFATKNTLQVPDSRTTMPVVEWEGF
jgi:hypothetical protein